MILLEVTASFCKMARKSKLVGPRYSLFTLVTFSFTITMRYFTLVDALL